MSEPWRHHWLPQFLMNGWADEQKKLRVLYRPHEDIAVSRSSSKSIGFQEGLYKCEWSGFDDPNWVEKKLFRDLVDTPAAQVREKLMAEGAASLTQDERDILSFFIMMQKIRTPEAIKKPREILISGLGSALDKAKQENPENAEKIDQLRPVAGDLVFQTLIDFVRKSPHWAVMRSVMVWKVLEMPSDGLELVLGDTPVYMKLQSEDLLREVWIPISPKHLLLGMLFEKYFEDELRFQDRFRSILPIDANSIQLKQARQFVVATQKSADGGYKNIAGRFLKPDR